MSRQNRIALTSILHLWRKTNMNNKEMEKRAKNWSRAKANAQLDGYFLPQAFAEQGEAFVKGIITLEQLEDFYASLLPDKETLQAMYDQYAQYGSGYMDVNIDDPRSLADIFAEQDAALRNEIVFNGMTVKNIKGMRTALGTYKSLLEEEKQDNV